MSHYTVLVIGDNVDDQLAPFDESIKVKYTRSKEEHIARGKKDIEDYKNNGLYATYLENPEEYLNKCTNDAHAKYISEEFPKKLKWTDEEIYQDQIRWYEPHQINEDGSTNETYNPNSKWDWYQIGGRWSGMIRVLPNQRSGRMGEKSWASSENDDPLQVDSAEVRDIDWDHQNMKHFGTFAVLKDGKWYERGEMGWWAIVSNEKPEEQWDQEFKKLIKDLNPETRITVVDCHI